MKTRLLRMVIATAVIAVQAVASKSGDIDCSRLVDECPPETSLVCASDGNTYDSMCAFAKAHCAHPDAHLEVVKEGPCSSEQPPTSSPESTGAAYSRDGDGVVEKAPELAPVPDAKLNAEFAPPESSVDTHVDLEPYCKLKCDRYGVEPICGSDHTSYINACHLLATKCHRPTLEKLYDGLCVVEDPTKPVPQHQSRISPSGPYYGQVTPQSQPISRVTEAYLSNPSVGTGFGTFEANEAVPVTTRPSTGGRCNPVCPRRYDPVCGSNGVTYANDCLLEYAMCTNPSIQKVQNGKCQGQPSASGASHSDGSHLARSAACVPSPCSAIEAPVCASNGQTYMNRCAFKNAQCEQPRLAIVHEGECGSHTELSCDTMVCPMFTECKQDAATGVAYCADICAPERCSELEDCELRTTECFTAPCSPVATCVPRKTD